MSVDTELETWRQQWRDQTEPLPELKRRIRRQNQRSALAVVAICVCLAVSAIAAWRTRSAFVAGIGAGIGFAGLVMGAYILRIRRGSWKPSAQTTLAYAELSHKRAVARVRTLRFSFWFLLLTSVALGIFLVALGLHGGSFHLRDKIIFPALVIELFFLKYQEKRKQREVEQTRKFLEDIKE